MNLFNLTFFCQYLYSPKTWLHGTKSKYKVAIIVLNLIFLCHSGTVYIIYNIPLIIIIIITLKIFMFYWQALLSPILIFISLILMNQNYNIDQITCTSVDIFIPKSIINFKLKYKTNTFFCLHVFKYKYQPTMIPIPNFILRIYFIGILYLIHIQILFLTTTYENIICILLSIFNKLNLQKGQKLLLISIISTQFLELVVNRINQLTISIKLRGHSKIKCKLWNSRYFLFIYSIYKFYNSITYDIHRIASTLYTREIFDKHFHANLLQKK